MSVLSAAAAPLSRYADWLHLRWPAGGVEPLPEVGPDGSTAVPGLFVVGDLTGVPLLKLSADSGARVVQAIAGDASFRAARGRAAGVRDLVVVGAGVSGMAAALEARRLGLDFVVLEARKPFATISDFPKGKPIYTYPRDMENAGELRLRADVKEGLLVELEAQTAGLPVTDASVTGVTRAGGALEVQVKDGEPVRALRVVLAIGRSGNFRELGCPGQDLPKVQTRLHDPADARDLDVLVVGGGDSACEAAIALARAGGRVTLAYRGTELNRPKPENVERVHALAREAGSGLTLALGTTVARVTERTAVLRTPRGELEQPNDLVFALIGREPPIDLLRRCGVRIAGDRDRRWYVTLGLFFLLMVALYNWKSGGTLHAWHQAAGGWPFTVEGWAAGLPATSLAAVAAKSASSPGFWFTLAYSAIVVGFGWRRIRTRNTPYITRQTTTLMAVQVVPLFLLPEILLPWVGVNGWLPGGLADALFPAVDYGHGREYWRAYGFVLAWPLFIYNVFTDQPLWAWLAISFVQTFVLVPLLVWRWGKGAYCGWICSCGALAETLGDRHRHKMPHGPGWNRLNLAGQVLLAVAFLLLALRVVQWLNPEWWLLKDQLYRVTQGSALSWKWVVDVFLAGAVGYGVYFWYSGRAWCRFFCPLAAWMHIVARFSRFAIVAEKKKCISCNVCTSVCHQGIDVMAFANKGRHMQDPECVRCSACVQSCPTGVLQFGEVRPDGRVIRLDRLPASPARLREVG